MKRNFFKHPTIISATRLACAAISAAALFGTTVPSAPIPDDAGHFPVIAGSEIPRQDGTEETGGGQEISPQNDDEQVDYIRT